MSIENIRNIAIIAHVDHGKTTLIDSMLQQSGTFRDNEDVSERVMDSNDIEKERGITILAKCTSIARNGKIINIIDTPGHADFGGEVERVLSMVDGVVLLVDSSEGPLPQTKFVLGKALSLGIKPIVLINKIDRPDRRIDEVVDEVFDLFIMMEANDEQLNFPIIYASGRDGYATDDLKKESKNLDPLFNLIESYVPQPKIVEDRSFSFVGTILEYDNFVGRVLTGKIYSGDLKVGQQVKSLSIESNFVEKFKITRIQKFNGIQRVSVNSASAGDIVSISGMTNTSVADTICDESIVEAISTSPIDPPTISILLGVSDSPFNGRDGKKLTSSLIKDRLMKESESNVSIQISDENLGDFFEVKGRGELQLGVLIENMRREGFELSVARPKVIFKEDESGNKLEPIEEVIVDVDNDHSGIVVEKMSKRKAEMKDMKTSDSGRTRIVFHIPSRGLIGYSNEFLSDTRGTGILNKLFLKYDKFKGNIDSYRNGVLIATELGKATAYSLFNLQDRGTMFVSPQDEIYEGMIVGEHNKNNDLPVNVVKGKQLTNVRASGSDEQIILPPAKKMTLESMISYIQDDELIEVTPNYLRLRKKNLKAKR